MRGEKNVKIVRTQWLHVDGLGEGGEQELEYLGSIAIVRVVVRRRSGEAHASLPDVLAAVYLTHALLLTLHIKKEIHPSNKKTFI